MHVDRSFSEERIKNGSRVSGVDDNVLFLDVGAGYTGVFGL